MNKEETVEVVSSFQFGRFGFSCHPMCLLVINGVLAMDGFMLRVHGSSLTLFIFGGLEKSNNCSCESGALLKNQLTEIHHAC